MAKQTRAGIMELNSPGYDLRGSPMVLVETKIDREGASALIQVIGPFQDAGKVSDYLLGEKSALRERIHELEENKPVLVNDSAWYMLPLYHPIP